MFIFIRDPGFDAIIPFVVSLCFLFFVIIENLELNKKTQIILGNGTITINILGLRTVKKKRCKKDGIEKVFLVREGVDKNEGPDTFPRYSILVMKDKAYKIIGPYKKDTIVEFGKSLARWANVDFIDTKDEYVDYKQNWNEI